VNFKNFSQAVQLPKASGLVWSGLRNNTRPITGSYAVKRFRVPRGCR
jgi:hypothetical protein